MRKLLPVFRACRNRCLLAKDEEVCGSSRFDQRSTETKGRAWASVR